MPASSQTRELLADGPFVVLLYRPHDLDAGHGLRPGGARVRHPRPARRGRRDAVASCWRPRRSRCVVFMLVGGVVADRYPRSLVLLWGQLLAAAVLGRDRGDAAHRPHPAVAAVHRLGVAGISGAAVYPALSGIIPDLVPAHLLQQGNAWLSMGASAARFVGLVASGAVVVWLGGGWAMMVAGTLYLVAAGLLLAAAAGRVARQAGGEPAAPAARRLERVPQPAVAVRLRAAVGGAADGAAGVPGCPRSGGRQGRTRRRPGLDGGAGRRGARRDHRGRHRHGLAPAPSDPGRHPAHLRRRGTPVAARVPGPAVDRWWSPPSSWGSPSTCSACSG